MYDEEIKLSKSAFRKLTEDTQDLYKECYELKLQLPEGYVVNKKSDEEFRLTFKTKQEFDNFSELFHSTSLSLSE